MISASAVTNAKFRSRNGAGARASSVRRCWSVCGAQNDHQALVVTQGNRIRCRFTHAITLGRQYDLAQSLIPGKVRLDGIGAQVESDEQTFTAQDALIQQQVAASRDGPVVADSQRRMDAPQLQQTAMKRQEGGSLGPLVLDVEMAMLWKER